MTQVDIFRPSPPPARTGVAHGMTLGAAGSDAGRAFARALRDLGGNADARGAPIAREGQGSISEAEDSVEGQTATAEVAVEPQADAADADGVAPEADNFDDVPVIDGDEAQLALDKLLAGMLPEDDAEAGPIRSASFPAGSNGPPATDWIGPVSGAVMESDMSVGARGVASAAAQDAVSAEGAAPVPAGAERVLHSNGMAPAPQIAVVSAAGTAPVPATPGMLIAAPVLTSAPIPADPAVMSALPANSADGGTPPATGMAPLAATVRLVPEASARPTRAAEPRADAVVPEGRVPGFVEAARSPAAPIVQGMPATPVTGAAARLALPEIGAHDAGGALAADAAPAERLAAFAPSAAATATSAAATATAATATAASGAPPASQIAEAARGLREGSIEITLSPRELGRVQMTLSPTETGHAIVLSVERDETLHLLRRHAAELQEAFAAMDLGSLDISFRERGAGGSPGGDAPGTPRPADPSARPETPAEPPVAAARRAIASDRLDLRI